MAKRHVVMAVPGICLLVVSLISARPAAGQTDTAPSHLGKVDFPTSCSAEAQPLLDKGLALLHSFQYTEARQTFEAAGTNDKKCAMAHWGQAMSLYEQLWEFPDDKQLKKGHKEIELARKLRTKRRRSKDF